MRGNDFLDKMELVSPAFIEAADEKPPHKNRRWIKWCAVAACLCIIAAIFPIASVIRNKGEHSDDGAEAIAALEYNGCYYEACDIDWALEKFGLPAEITADMAGKHISYLKSDGGAGYKETANQTDIELYQYAPFSCRAVYVLRDGKDYMAALFCNFKQFDSNTNTELRELYKIYGVNSPEDIASISHTDWNKGKLIGNKVTDIDAIAEFYTITNSLVSYGNDDFQAEVFDEITEDKQTAAHTAFADDNITICIETTSGLRFFIQVYPSYHWIYGGGTMNYYKMDKAMQAWFNSNIK